MEHFCGTKIDLSNRLKTHKCVDKIMVAALNIGCVAAEAQIIEMTQNEARYGSDSIVSLGIDQ